MSMEKERAPVITVLMSCFNGSRWLAEAIESVLIQSFKKFEFIIVDDGSTDDSIEIIKKYANNDRRIVVISKNNTGLADSLNVGLRKARGAWIARIDTDDVCEPTRLKKQLDEVKANAKLVYVGTDLTIIDEHGVIGAKHFYPQKHNELVKNLLLAKKFPAHSSAFFKTESVRLIGGYRPRISKAEDRDLWLRLSEHGEFASVGEALIQLRKHANNISNKDSGRSNQIDSHIASVSYWLRQGGHPDPVEADLNTFLAFRGWVVGELEKEKAFEFTRNSARISTSLSKIRVSPPSIFQLIKDISSNPYWFFRYLFIRIYGSCTAKRLAKKWIHNSSTK